MEFFFVGICWCACGQGERTENIINLTCRETATVAVSRRVERGRGTIICSKMGPHLFWGALIKVDLSIKSVGYVRKVSFHHADPFDPLIICRKVKYQKFRIYFFSLFGEEA